MSPKNDRWLAVGALFAAGVGFWLVLVGVLPQLGFDLALSMTFPHSREYAGGPTGLGRLATSVSGALTVFVGVLAWALRPVLGMSVAGPLVARAFVLALGVWFVLDSSASVLIGAPMNAAGNVLLLIALFPPLFAASRPRHDVVGPGSAPR